MLVVARFMACLNTTDGCGDGTTTHTLIHQDTQKAQKHTNSKSTHTHRQRVHTSSSQHHHTTPYPEVTSAFGLGTAAHDPEVASAFGVWTAPLNARLKMCCVCLYGCVGVAAGNVLVVFLVIEAILFGLFTCCMMLDQWTVVSTNTTSKTETHVQRSMGLIER
jgi:hypothetical protein